MKYTSCFFALLFVCGVLIFYAQNTPLQVENWQTEYQKVYLFLEKDAPKAHSLVNKLRQQLQNISVPTLETANNWHSLGKFYYDEPISDYRKASDCFEQALKIRQKLLPAIHNDLARNYFMLGATHKFLGNYTSAKEFLIQALSISQTEQNTFMCAKEGLELGEIYHYLNDYEQSRATYELSFSHILNAPQQGLELRHEYFKRLATTYFELSQYQVALNHYASSAKIYLDSMPQNADLTTKSWLFWSIGSCFSNMNLPYQKLGKLDSAYLNLQKALSFYNQTTNSKKNLVIGNVYLELGHLRIKQNRFDEAESLYKKAEAYLNPFIGHSFLSECLTAQGDVFLYKGQNDKALIYYQKSLVQALANPHFTEKDVLLPPSVSSIQNTSQEVLKALSGKAKVFKTLENNNLAIKYYRVLDTLISGLRTSFKEDGSKFNLSKEALPIYENAIEAALTIGDTAGALDFCERNKAVVLREALQDVNAKQSLKIDPSVLAHEKALRERISYYQKQRFDANDSLRGIWQDSIQRTKGELETLIKDLERAEPNYFKQKYAPIQTLSIADIQKNLPPEMLLLEYFMGDNQLFIFAISKNKTAVYPLTLHVLTQANATTLPLGFRDSITVFLQNIKNPSPDATHLSRCASTSYTLYNWLLQRPLNDFNADGHITRLRIVPDGILNYVPFDALIEQPTTDLKRRDVAYILKKYAVSYIVSNQLLNTSVTPKSHWSFGQTNFGGFGINYQNTPLSKLPFAESEITKLQEKVGGDAFTQSNKKALRTTFLAKAQNYNILHLSMHGTVDDHEPMKSALQFVNEKDSLDPLAVIDVNNLQLTNNELTVLSACNTGTGVLQRGEGIMSLSRAFAQAGCRALVMSLWTLQDAYTTEIISSFYDNLIKKQPKDIALALAKRQFLSADQSERRAPNYWASLVVMGSIEQITVSDSHWQIWILGVFIVLLGLGAWFWLKTESNVAKRLDLPQNS